MAELNPDISADVLAACQAGKDEAAEALSRALDSSIQLAVDNTQFMRGPTTALVFELTLLNRGSQAIGFELSDLTLYVIDVSAGDKIPRKGGPGIMKSDLLIINKIDLAPHVGASLEVMDRDARKMRGERPFVFTNLKTGQGLQAVIDFILDKGMLRGKDRQAIPA